MARLVDINYPANVIHEGVKREFKLIPPLSKKVVIHTFLFTVPLFRNFYHMNSLVYVDIDQGIHKVKI